MPSHAGYGWSDFVDVPADAARSAEQLHSLLRTAGEDGPYLFIGHCYGGFILRWCARRHRSEVAGLVLLDSSAPEQLERLPAGALPALPRGTPQRTMRMPQLPAGFPSAHATTARALMLLPKARLATVAELREPVLIVSRGRQWAAHHRFCCGADESASLSRA